MNTGNEDRRVIKTKLAIKNTFEQMIVDMDYSDITIKELAQRANINRKTFYLHYTSLEDLFNELQCELAQRLIAIIDFTVSNKAAVNLRQYLNYFHNLVMENPLLHKKLMFSDSYQFVFTNVNTTLMKKWLLEHLPESTQNEELRLIFDISCACIFAAYRSWFIYECAMPAERLKDIIENQIRYGLSGSLNI